MLYVAIKHLHVICVFLSFCGFVLRGALMLAASPRLNHRLFRVVPHVIDTVLLGSAIVLALLLRQAPFVDAWLTAKVLGLLVYIGLGTVALKRGRTLRLRVLALLAALATFGYIVSVALTHDARGVLLWVTG